MAIQFSLLPTTPVIPGMTKVAWHLQKDEIQQSRPSETRSKFVYNLSKAEYQKEWGHIYEKPGLFARVKAFVLRLVPQKGSFSGLDFHPPTPVIEHMYMDSFNQTLDHYRALLVAKQNGELQVPNENLDTGTVTGAAAYQLTDKTYAQLLEKTSGKPISKALRDDLLSYYADLNKPFATKHNSDRCMNFSRIWRG